ncbi:hypothetical protein BD626DRAFT_519792, partial [Schizophyllum amplum]
TSTNTLRDNVFFLCPLGFPVRIFAITEHRGGIQHLMYHIAYIARGTRAAVCSSVLIWPHCRNIEPALYALKYNVMPYVGLLTYGEAARSEEPVAFPEVKTLQ